MNDARLVCPVCPGADQSIHWGHQNPTGFVGTDEDRRAAFERAFTLLADRIRQFVMIAGRQRTAAAGRRPSPKAGTVPW